MLNVIFEYVEGKRITRKKKNHQEGHPNRFGDYWSCLGMDLYYHNMTGYSAVTKGGIELAETINFYRASPYHKAVGEQLSLEGSTIPGGYRAGNWPQIREVIYENVEPMLNGKISIEKGLKNMDIRVMLWQT